MKQLTKEQKALISSLESTFKQFNEQKKTSVKFNYFDVTPFVEEADKIEEEKRECEMMYMASIKAQLPIIQQNLELLAEDLIEVLNCSITPFNSMSGFTLEIKSVKRRCQNPLRIRGEFEFLRKNLSDGTTYVAYDVKQNYNFYTSYDKARTFDNFEDMVSSPDFHEEIKKLLK